MKGLKKVVKRIMGIGIAGYVMMAVGVGLDLLGRNIAAAYNMPIWFDSVGTIYTAVMVGPLAGVVVGLVMSLITGITDISAVWYALVSMAVGFVAGMTYPGERNRRREDFFGVAIVGFYTTLVAVICSTPINLYYYDGYTGNLWGDALVDKLSTMFPNPVIRAAAGEGFVDFPDKVLCVFIVALIIKVQRLLTHKLDKRRQRAALLLLPVGAFLLSLLPAPTTVSAEGTGRDFLSEYAPTYFGMDDGLASIEINSVTQPGDGYIWVGGYSGLYFYDGSGFYQIDLGKGISSVTTLYTAKNGDLWIGTNDVGVVRFSVKNQTSKVYGTASGLSSESVRSICEDDDGNIYVGTVVSPCVITSSGVVGKYDGLEGISNVTSMSANGDWICGTTGNGVLFLMKQGTVYQTLSSNQMLYNTVAWGKDNELMVGTTGNELVRFTLEGDQLVSGDVIECPDHSYFNSILYNVRYDGYFVCADDGMMYLDKNGGMTDLSTPTFNNSVKSVVRDYQGNFWFSSDKQGILRYSTNVFDNIGRRSNLPEVVTNAILKKDGLLYIGSDEGLYIIDEETHEMVQKDYLDRFSGVRIRHLMEDSKGNIWVSTYDDLGLVKITPEDELISFNKENTIIRDSRMRSCIELKNGDIVAAMESGIMGIRNGEVIYNLGERNGLETPQILSLVERDDGTILAGSDGGGIYIIEDGQVVDSLSARDGLKSMVVTRIVPCKGGYLYITSNAIYYDNGSKISMLDKFPYGNNYDGMITKDGVAWILSSAGIYLVKEQELIANEGYDYVLLNYTRGFDTSLTSGAWNTMDEESLYLCCSDGIRQIRVGEYKRFKNDFIIDIHSFMIDNEEILYKNKSFSIPADVSKIEFKPAILNYSLTNPLVRVYVEGMEDMDFVQKQNELQTISLGNLSYGTYAIHIQILDEAVHTKVLKEEVFKIEKEARLYEQWYFKIYQYSVLVMLIIYMVWIFARMRNMAIINQQYDQIREARDEAESANKAKSKFLAQMSHEIRTPINAVLGMDEMILRESTEKEVRDYAADIYTAGQTLLALINDILDSSKIESGKMEIVPVEYEISSVVHDLYNMIFARAQDKELFLEVDVDPNLPTMLYGDDVRIRQIITNLLTNAVKYTPTGTIWFRVSGFIKGEDVAVIHVEVEDTGMGMKKEDMEGLFDAYQRVNLKKTRSIEGTGLGLSITSQLLKLMGSRLQVESEYEKGSKFFFDLEQRVIDPTPIGDFNKRVEISEDHAAKGSGFSAPEASVLVVDDNSMNRKVFKSLLKTTRIQVTEAESGQQSIDLASKNKYDIIFMDHMMPGMDGVEAMHKIREIIDGPCKDTPIYILTANAVTGAKEAYLQEGFDGFISKPVAPEKLEEKIVEALPPEMIKPPVEGEEVSRTSQKGSEPPEDLPMVEGMDWNFAWMHLPDLDILKETLKEFYELLPVHQKKLDGMYKDLQSELVQPSTEDGLAKAFEAYRIQVHSMKGAASTVGIVPLAGMAKVLEFAAKDENEDIIDAIHSIFIREWLSYTGILYGVFDIGKDEGEKEEGTKEIFEELSSQVVLALEDMDIDAADEHMGKLKGYTFGEKVDPLLKELSAAVADLDEDAAREVTEQIKEIL